MTIRIKRSTITAIPPTLAYGELAYSEGAGKKLFVGGSSAIQEIAGDSYAKLASPTFTGTTTIPTLQFVNEITQSAPSVGTVKVYSKLNDKIYKLTSDGVETEMGPDTIVVTQISHSFNIGNIIAINSSGTYILAKADSLSTSLVVGIVSFVNSANIFTLLMTGVIQGGGTLTGLSPGSQYYLSNSTAGGFTNTNIYSLVYQVPVFTTINSTDIIVNIQIIVNTSFEDYSTPYVEYTTNSLSFVTNVKYYLDSTKAVFLGEIIKTYDSNNYMTQKQTIDYRAGGKTLTETFVYDSNSIILNTTTTSS